MTTPTISPGDLTLPMQVTMPKLKPRRRNAAMNSGRKTKSVTQSRDARLLLTKQRLQQQLRVHPGIPGALVTTKLTPL